MLILNLNLKDNKHLFLVLFIVLYVFSLVALFSIYNLRGVSWDFVAHYLNAKSMISSNFLNYIKPLGQSTIVINSHIYFETDRAPLDSVIMGLIMLSGAKEIIPIYITILATLLFISIYLFSKYFKVNPLISASVIITPYILKFSFLLNSSGALSIAMLLISLALIKKGSIYSGAFMALAGLAKYISIIFFPLLLLLGSNRKRAESIALLFIVSLPWLLFNLIALGNPFYSYLASFSVYSNSTPGGLPILGAIGEVLGNLVFPIMVLLILAGYLFYRRSRMCSKDNDKNIMHYLRSNIADLKSIIMNKGSTAQILASLFLLSVIQYLIVVPRMMEFDQIRLSYFVYIAIALMIITALNGCLRKLPKNKNIRLIPTLVIMIIFSVSLLNVAYLSYSVRQPSSNWMISATNNSTLKDTVAELQLYNLSNCNVVSNSWIYLRYYGIKAYSPFYYNNTILKYPVVLIEYQGVNETYVKDKGASLLFKEDMVDIYLPNGFECVTT